jgi:Holliday junction resolvase
LGHKSDVVQGRKRLTDRAARVECKATMKKSLTLKLEWFEKITREAIDSGREPVVALRLEAATLAERDWVLIPRSTYVELTS